MLKTPSSYKWQRAENIHILVGTRPGGREYKHQPVSAGTDVGIELCPTGKDTRVRKECARTRKSAKPALTCGATAEEVYIL
jgi:hypothetical protein